MVIVESSWEVYWPVPGEEMLRTIEKYGRTAYKSERLIDDDSAEKFVRMLLQRGHESVLEHMSVSARVVCDRGVSHEIVRHRIASYTQESTRYCDYSKSEGEGKGQVVFVKPVFDWDKAMWTAWTAAMERAEQAYGNMRKLGAKPQEARSVLPNSLKTEIVMTMNLREWRHFFRLRAAPPAHPDMQRIAYGLLAEFRKHVAVIFDEELLRK